MKRPVFIDETWNEAISANLRTRSDQPLGSWDVELRICGSYRTDVIFTDNEDSIITVIYGDDNIMEIYFGDQRSNHLGHMASKEQLVNFVFNRSGSEELQTFFLFNQLL